jgi:hypothetical protein
MRWATVAPGPDHQADAVRAAPVAETKTPLMTAGFLLMGMEMELLLAVSD